MALEPGAVIEKDPNAEKLYVYDWTDWLAGAAQVATFTLTITEGDGALTKDNELIVGSGKQVQVRVKAGTKGKRYKLTCQIVSNESPPQRDERSVYFLITDQ